MTNIFAKRQLITFGLVLCGTLSLTACDASGTTTGSNGIGNSSSSSSPLTSASAILSKAQSASYKDASLTYSNTSKSSGGGGADVNTQLTGPGELTHNPSRSHLTLTGSINNQTVAIESITDGSTLYTKSSYSIFKSDGFWHQTKVDAGSSAVNLDKEYAEIQNPKLVGTETVNGYSAYHITGTPAPNHAVESTVTQSGTEDIWIRTDNFYPLKFSGKSTSTDSSDGTTDTSSISVVFNKWDSGISIALPPPSQIKSGV
jgi:hypothetical protein